MIFSTKVGALIPPEVNFTLSFIAITWFTYLLTYATLAANVTAGNFGPNIAHCTNCSIICICIFLRGGVSMNRRNGVDVQFCGSVS